MRTRWAVTMLAVVMTMLSAGAALAQPGGGRREAMRQEVREKIRAHRTAALIELLDLDEKTTMRLMPLVNKAYDEIGALASDNGKARRELRGLIQSGSNDAGKINPLIDRMLANRQRIARIEEDLLRQARGVLTPAQSGTLVIGLPEINRRIEQQIRKAVRGGGLDDD